LALTVTREYATPPTKLATEPSRNTVFAKLVQTSILSRVSILYSPGRIQRRPARGPSVADPAQGARSGRIAPLGKWFLCQLPAEHWGGLGGNWGNSGVQGWVNSGKDR
jgi:hypothetical protein